MRIDRTLSRILNEPLWGWLHSSKVNRVTKGWFTKTRLSTKIFNNNRYCPGRNAARGSRNLKITRNWIYVAKLVTKGVSRFTLFLRPKFAQNVFLFSISPLVSETCYVLFRTKAVQDCVSLLRRVIHSRSIFRVSLNSVHDFVQAWPHEICRIIKSIMDISMHVIITDIDI